MTRCPFLSAGLGPSLLRTYLIAIAASAPRCALGGRVVINEVSDKGTDEGDCGGFDWVELLHIPANDADTEALSLGGFVLHDDNGPDDEGAFLFPRVGPLSSILPGQYLVLCAGAEAASLPQFKSSDDGGASGTAFIESSSANGAAVITAIGPLFRVGGDDTVVLADANGGVVSSVGPLPDLGEDGWTYIRLPDGSGYDYTTAPTPGYANVYASVAETVDERRERMRLQNAEGERFFGMDGQGLPVPDAFEDVVDLSLEMVGEDFDDMMTHRSHRAYKPFQSATVLSRSSGTELLSLGSGGRIRTKGAWTLLYTTCTGLDTVPFSIDFDTNDSSQTLFGAQRVYLRNHVADLSYMREWAQHRMLARFGLPHLRTRKARLFVNGRLLGLYDLMEAADQEYVFARSFPNYDPFNYVLYKVKNSSIGCGKPGMFTPEKIAAAEARMADQSPPPYAWERGDHQPDFPVYGPDRYLECIDYFSEFYGREEEDKVLAYVRHGMDCSEMVLEEDLVDRDLGTNNWDDKMKAFYGEHLGSFQCYGQDCADSDLPSDIDVDNFLKIFAFYAVTFNMDSPLDGGKNYYLANAGGGGGGDGNWRIFPYDFDNSPSRIGAGICGQECESRMIHWSVLRPTCRGIETSQLASPLLSRPDLMERYLKFVREFTETVLNNQAFIQEIQDHAHAIQSDVEADSFSLLFSRDFTPELSPSSVPWDYDWTSPLLPVITARAEDVMEQLDAIDEGAYPMIEQVDGSAKCVDWRTVPTSACFMGCKYEGCYQASWTVPAYCDEETATCYHGDLDALCNGVENLDQYPNMEPFYDGMPAYCWEGRKTAVCPPPTLQTKSEDKEESTTIGANGSSNDNEGGGIDPDVEGDGGDDWCFDGCNNGGDSSPAKSRQKSAGCRRLPASVAAVWAGGGALALALLLLS